MPNNKTQVNNLINYIRANTDPKELVFNGGRISSFSAKLGNEPIDFNFEKLSDPSDIKTILKFEKIIPTIPTNYSGVTKNYIYVYLDPFKPAPTDYGYVYKLPFPVNGNNEIRFGFEPFYIGKGVSSTGHRFNQHLANFIQKDSDMLENPYKQEKFRSIERMMIQSNQGPKNWKVYKEEWIKIMFEFDDRLTLERVEKMLIQLIGSVGGSKKGPLTNITLTKN